MPLKVRKIIFYIFIGTVFLPAAVSAVPLSQYKTDVGTAADIIYSSLYTEDEELKSESDAERFRAIAAVRKILPPRQTVEFGNTSIEADNNALHNQLQAFESEKDSAKRLKIAQDISEYLIELETKLDELEKQTAGRAKDEERRKLNEILSRPEYQKPEEKRENPLLKALEDFIEWIFALFPRPNFGTPSLEGLSGLSSALQVIILLIVLGIIGFLLYRFAPALFKNFGRGEKREKNSRVILGETVAADETSENLFGEAENLARAGDLRAAIRKGYIALLCELSDRKIIGLARHKTNRDYLRDVRSRENLYRNMRGLTASFERHWYGFDAPAGDDWEEFKKIYSETVSKF